MNKIYIARGEHYNIPGQHFSVHATLEGAKDSALASLNMIRADLGMDGVRSFSERAVQAVKKVLERRGDDPDECDVWIEPHWVKP